MSMFQAPVASGTLGYGYIAGKHYAQDYEVPKGTPVYAAAQGTVLGMGDDGALGDTITIRHAGGYETKYGNLGKYLVLPGENVVQGQEIGTSDGDPNDPNPGDSNGAHLPYQVWLNGKAINPVTVTANPTGKAPETAGQASESIWQSLGNALNLFSVFTNPTVWLRVGLVAAGATLLILVLVLMFAKSETGQNAIATGKSALKDAGEAAVIAPK